MIHIVQKGETLIQIAKKYNTSLATLIDENNIKNPNLISVGSTLIISEPDQKIISHPELTPDNIDTKIEDFLSAIVQVHGASLMRYKGILNIKGVERRIVFQGVHMLMGMDGGAAWAADEQRHSRIVFIGKNMPKQLILQGLERCLVPAHTGAAKAQKST